MTRDPQQEALEAIAKVAIDLFYGWGYNFYRVENQIRADDLLIRGKISDILAAARASVEKAEADFRREHLPAPSRERPRLDPQAMQKAQQLESLSREIGSLEGRIRSLPVPESDRMSRRFHEERELLVRLASADELLVGSAEMLRALLVPATASWLSENDAAIREHLSRIRNGIEARRGLAF